MSAPEVTAPSVSRVESVRPVQTASLAGSASLKGPDLQFDPERPWLLRPVHSRPHSSATSQWYFPPSVLPLVLPPDPWPLAQACGLLEGENWSELREAMASGAMASGQTRRVADLVVNHLQSRHGCAWKALASLVRAMEPPVLESALRRLLPPQSQEMLDAAWQSYQMSLLESLWWETPEDPHQDWRVRALRFPFPIPSPAPIPPPPVAPSPDLWLAWLSPSQGVVEPILLQAVGAPRAAESPEIRHESSGFLTVPTVMGTPLCLDQPTAEPIIRALHHLGGLWIDETPLPES